MLQRRGLRELAERLDAETYGGAALLGLEATVVIAHGAVAARGAAAGRELAATWPARASPTRSGSAWARRAAGTSCAAATRRRARAAARADNRRGGCRGQPIGWRMTDPEDSARSAGARRARRGARRPVRRTPTR